jgi:hypothetical protein
MKWDNATIARRKEDQELEQRYGKWHRWFAWYPVADYNNPQWIWLQIVERKLTICAETNNRDEYLNGRDSFRYWTYKEIQK